MEMIMYKLMRDGQETDIQYDELEPAVKMLAALRFDTSNTTAYSIVDNDGFIIPMSEMLPVLFNALFY
jgi:hypothetical protein